MKIFSNFDTNRKKEAYEEAKEKFGEENILILSKSGLFFFDKVFYPMTGWTLLFMLLTGILYYFTDERGILRISFLAILMLLYGIIISPNIKYYLDYTMDFSVVTPDTLTRYNQSGFFKRDIKTSNVRNIKTISVQKNSFRYSLFDNGDLIFLSEGDHSDQGEITLHYIKDPETKKKLIIKIMKQ